MRKDYKWLHFVWYKDLTFWSAQYYISDEFKFNKNYELNKIGSFLERNKTLITVEDDGEYKRVTIKINNGGCCLRDIAMGKNIGTKIQNEISKGQFIISKIDARNGAFGIVPESLDKAIVTNDFPVFDINTGIINPQFLLLITSTERFKSYAQKCSNGTTNRQRIDIDDFLNVKIPTPQLTTQQLVVDAYNSKFQLAETNEKQSAILEDNIQTYLIDKLNIKINTTGNKFFFLKSEFIDSRRWDTLFFMPKKDFESDYHCITLGECLENFITDIDGKSLRIDTYKMPEQNFSYIGMENVEKETGNLIDFQYVSGNTIKSQTIKVPKYYFLYGKLRPYLNKYWYNDTDEKNIVCSSEFFVFSIKNTINPYYFLYYLSSTAVQKQIEKLSQGARMPRINEKTFKSIKVPLPPLDVQDEIAKHISTIRQQIKKLKQQAINLRETAFIEFENEIFE